MIELRDDALVDHSSIDLSQFDLLLIALGYERRSSAFPRRAGSRATRTMAISFRRGHVHSYSSNRAVLVGYECEIVELEDSDVRRTVAEQLEAILSGRETVRVAIDISCFTRIRIAAIVLALMDASKVGTIDVTFLYSIAGFTAPVTQEQPNIHFGPVLPEFAGWFDSTDDPPIAIVGLGYEQDRALGALEHLQIDERRLFLPESLDPQFEPHLLEANSVLLESASEEQIFRYSLRDPIATFGRIQSLARGIQLSGNLLLLPFGPKIFALVCLLFGAMNHATAVWRVSTEGGDPEVDVAEGTLVVTLRVAFQKETE